MFTFVGWMVFLVGCGQVVADDPIARYREAAIQQWEADIRELEQLDAQSKDPENAILMVGSSSVRLWDTMAEDLAPWPTIRRGYGGAKFSDLSHYIDRLVAPHQFRALLVFVANDITGGEDDKEPSEVLRLYQYVVGRVRRIHPDKPIFFISITPTPSRWGSWPRIQEVNRQVCEYSATQPGLYFINTVACYLGEDGKPRPELFRDDELHLNSAGYQIWSKMIRCRLEEVLKNPE